MKILVTDGGYKHTLGIIRSLGKKGHVVDCIGSRYCLCRFSKYLNKVAFPQEKFNQYHFEEFISYIKKSDYDQVIAVGARSVELLSKNRESLSGLISLNLADHVAINTCLNKVETNALALKLDVPIPKTWVTQSDVNDLLHEKITYPAVIKSASEINKFDPLYAKSKYELNCILESLVKTDSLLIQQYIDGDGYGFFALYDKGNIKQYFMHKRVREYPVSGGPSSCAISIYEPKLYEYGKRLLDALKWHGVAMVEFKRSSLTGEFYLMEINPKFWGSHDLAIASGADFSLPLLGSSNYINDEKTPGYKILQKFHWPLDGDIQHAIKNPKAIAAVLIDLINPKVKSNIEIFDLAPSFYTIVKKIMVIFLKIPVIRHVERVGRIGFLGAAIRGLTEFTGVPILKYSLVRKNFAIGMQPSKLGYRVLAVNGFDAILNLRSEFSIEPSNAEIHHFKNIPIIEYQTPTIEQLKEGVAFINKVTNGGGKIYIHCREGVSRAPLFAAAYMVSLRTQSIDDILCEIKKIRPFINILPNQMATLNEYAKDILNGEVDN